MRRRDGSIGCDVRVEVDCGGRLVSEACAKPAQWEIRVARSVTAMCPEHKVTFITGHPDETAIVPFVLTMYPGWYITAVGPHA